MNNQYRAYRSNGTFYVDRHSAGDAHWFVRWAEFATLEGLLEFLQAVA